MYHKKTNWSWPIHSIFDEVFDDISKAMGADDAEMHPKVNVWTDENLHVIELAIPGFSKQEVNIGLDGKTLKIEGQKPEKDEKSVKKYKRREFYYTNFTKSFELPDEIDVNNIEASYENGILLINLPLKKEEDKVEKTIKIH